jgi:hypothetical protein
VRSRQPSLTSEIVRRLTAPPVKRPFLSGCLATIILVVIVVVLAFAAPGLVYPLIRGERATEIHLMLFDRNNQPVPNAELTFNTFDEQVILPIPWSNGKRVRRPIYATTDRTGYCRIQFQAKDCSLEEIVVAGERRTSSRQHDFGRDPLTPSEHPSVPNWWGGPGRQVYVTQVWIQ